MDNTRRRRSAYRFARPGWLGLLLVLMLMAAGVLRAQDSNDAALLAHTCVYNTETEQSEIRLSLFDASGAAVVLTTETLTLIRDATGEEIPDEAITITPLEVREPVSLVYLLDRTDTMPLDEVLPVVRDGLTNRLREQDEVSVLDFGNEIQNRSPFYDDMAVVINDLLADPAIIFGDNVLNDALLEAVEAVGGDEPTNSRRVVLLVTDSTPNETDQVSTQAVIDAAVENKVQIFAIGFQDAQDSASPRHLFGLANATEGFAWFFDDETTRADIAARVGTLLNEFHNVLNREVLLTVDLAGQVSPGIAQVGLEVAVQVDDQTTVTDVVNCRVVTEAPPTPTAVPVDYTLDWADRFDDLTLLSDDTTVSVAPEPPLDSGDRRINFLVDDEVRQSQSALDFTINLAELDLSPGPHQLSAELRDVSGETVLATAPTITFFVDLPLTLTTASGATTDLFGSITIVAEGDASVAGETVNFTAERGDDSVSLGSAVMDDSGTARLVVPAIDRRIDEIAPGYAGEPIIVTATIPSASAGAPDLAVSDRLAITVRILPIWLREPWIALAVALTLLLLNWLVNRRIHVRRILRLIAFPDGHPLPGGQKIKLTVVREDQSRTEYPLDHPTFLIGRGSEYNDINLSETNPNISRQHGAVIWRRRRWYYTNRKNRLKTRIDGHYRSRVRLIHLKPGMMIEIGQARLIFDPDNMLMSDAPLDETILG